MKKIIHVDMDAFYASVEMRDFPEYKNIPLAVGGTSPRSVLCTCNYLARQYGVHSAMPTITAQRLCPELKIVKGRMAIYQEVSQQIREIFKRYTNIIEPLSLDEAYLDVTNSTDCNGSATLIAKKIRADIFNELNLTASAGVAPNKFLAKIASDENKPNGQCVIPPNKVNDFVENLILRKIPGIGPKTAEKLAKRGFTTCADVRKSSIEQLKTIVGKFSAVLYQRSFGIDDRELMVTRLRKSLAVETTLLENVQTFEQCMQVINQLSPKLVLRLTQVKERQICRQGIKLKFADFNQTTVEQHSDYCDLKLFESLLKTALDRSQGRTVRLIGLTLGFTKVVNKEIVSEQLESTSHLKQLSLAFNYE